MRPTQDDPPLTPQAQAERERRAAARARARELVAPLVAELASVGHPVERIWDLVDSKDRYPKAIPLLVAWIPKVAHDPSAADWVLRAIGKPWAKGAVPGLLEAYAVPDYPDSVRWLIADGLEQLWRHVPTDALAELVLDAQWSAGSRNMLLRALGKQAGKKPQARDAIVAALADPALGARALQWILKHDIPVDAAAVEPYLADDRAWARADAERIVARG